MKRRTPILLLGLCLIFLSAHGASAGKKPENGNPDSSGKGEKAPLIIAGQPPVKQIITFEQPSDRSTTDPPFEIVATVNSPLTVTLEVISGPATIDGNIVTLTGAEGVVTIRATQPGTPEQEGGGTAFSAADPVERSFTVSAPMNADPFEGVSLGEGFFFSDWYGIYNTTFYPWIFHVEHGWQFVFETGTVGEVFVFDLESQDFWFTSKNFLPVTFFSFNRGTFNFYFTGTTNPRQFVDLETEEFFSIPAS